MLPRRPAAVMLALAAAPLPLALVWAAPAAAQADDATGESPAAAAQTATDATAPQANAGTGVAASAATGSHAGAWWAQQGTLDFQTGSSGVQSNADSHVAQHWTGHAASSLLDDVRAFLPTHQDCTSHVPVEVGLHAPADTHIKLASMHDFLI